MSDNDLDSDNEKLIASCFDFIDSDYNGESDEDADFNHLQQHHHQVAAHHSHHRTIGPFFNINNIEDFHQQQQQILQQPIQPQQQPQQPIQPQPQQHFKQASLTSTNSSTQQQAQKRKERLAKQPPSVTVVVPSSNQQQQLKGSSSVSLTSNGSVATGSNNLKINKSISNGNNSSGNIKRDQRKPKTGKSKQDSDVSSIKILKRNEDNIDPEQLNKLFNKVTTGSEDDDKDKLESNNLGTTSGNSNKSNGGKRRGRGDRKSRSQNNNGKQSGSKDNKSNGSGGSNNSVSRKSFNRKLGETPIHYDLDSVLFSPANTFQVKEIVLVPRSRGGFTYGKILSIVNSDTCNHDTLVKHTVLQYRAVYPSGSGNKNDNFYKDLPASYLGKLVPLNSITRTNRSHVISRADLPQVVPDIIGKKPSLRDLNSLIFAPTSKFQPNQIVLVPRSKGGFTYGSIVRDCKVSCKVDNIKHDVPGYRVLVEKNNDQTIIKDVIVGNIGRVFISLENPNTKLIYPIITSLHPQQQQQNPSRRKDRDHHINNNNNNESNSKPTSNVPSPKLNQKNPINITNNNNNNSSSLSSDDNEDYESDDSDGEELSGGEFTDSNDSDEEEEEEENGEIEISLDSSNDESNGGNHSMDDSDEEEILWTGDSSPIIEPQKLLIHQISPNPQQLQQQQQKQHQNNNNIQRGGILEVPHDSALYTQSARQQKKNQQSCVVIDGPNVAKYINKKFSVSLLKKALDYYNNRGYDVVAFVPQSYVSIKSAHEPGKNFTLYEYRDIADDVGALQKLVEMNLVSLTPSQDYDDSYTIQYAKTHNACIVTNDRFKDHIDNQETQDMPKVRKFIREHCISFTFVKGEFLPNPDFKFPV